MEKHPMRWFAPPLLLLILSQLGCGSDEGDTQSRKIPKFVELHNRTVILGEVNEAELVEAVRLCYDTLLDWERLSQDDRTRAVARATELYFQITDTDSIEPEMLKKAMIRELKSSSEEEQRRRAIVVFDAFLGAHESRGTGNGVGPE